MQNLDERMPLQDTSGDHSSGLEPEALPASGSELVLVGSDNQPHIIEGVVTPGLERHPSATPGEPALDPETVRAAQAMVDNRSKTWGEQLDARRGSSEHDATYVTLEAVRDMPDQHVRTELTDIVVGDFLKQGDVYSAFQALKLAGTATREMRQRFTDADIRAWVEQLRRTGRLEGSTH